MTQEVLVPDIGDFDEVDVIDVLVCEGDTVAEDDALITLESDKASMDIPSPAAGVVKSLEVKVGDQVSEGSLILTLESMQTDSMEKPAQYTSQPSEPIELAKPVKAVPASKVDALLSSDKIYASPSVRRLAREMKIDLGVVPATGRKARVTKEDLFQFADQGGVVKANSSASGAKKAAREGAMSIPPVPAVDFSQFGEIEETPLSRIQKISGPFLHRAWLNIPMVTHHDEADMTELEAFRQSLKPEAEKRGVRVTALVFIMKALANAMAAYPKFNSSLSADGESLIYKRYCNIGIAVDTPNGLVVPVFKDVDKKSIFELSEELGEMSKKARDGKLTPKDMSGGCISISSLGGIGGTAFTPIVNAPEVAILGVTRSQMKPVWDGSEFVPRLMTPLDLTYDHRVIDGAAAARFMVHLCNNLADMRRVLL